MEDKALPIEDKALRSTNILRPSFTIGKYLVQSYGYPEFPHIARSAVDDLIKNAMMFISNTPYISLMWIYSKHFSV